MVYIGGNRIEIANLRMLGSNLDIWKIFTKESLKKNLMVVQTKDNEHFSKSNIIKRY